MKLVSVNVGLPKNIEINGRPVTTGIYKQPIIGPVAVRPLGLAGDAQADLKVHGGVHQALYAYPLEHYAHWQQYLDKDKLPAGTFGENLTVTGLLENDVCIGDILRIGNKVEVQITMPRIPCFKFGHKIGKPEILHTFLHSGFSGFYLRVLQTGTISANDEIHRLKSDPHSITIRMALGMQSLGEGDNTLLQKALQVESLPPLLRRIYKARLVNR